MSHGSSPAAWTAVIVSLVGLTLGAVALIPEPRWTLFTIACVLTVASIPIGKVMALAGLGVNGKSH